jgi:site-specific DNA-methyltransferase (adenine-specific)
MTTAYINNESSIFYNDEFGQLILGDSIEKLKNIKTESIDLIIADPPYFLSNGGFSNSGGKAVLVDKGEWDKKDFNEIDDFYQNFLDEVTRILKSNGTFWVFGSMHNIYKLGYLIQKMDLKILNNIVWQKSNPAPNLSRRMFTHSTETILWVKKKDGKQIFNYDLMREQNGDKQMKDVWITSNTSSKEKSFGKHPTQKPISIFNRIIESSSNAGDIILDPFTGSGTAVVAAKNLNRKYIGIDITPEYLEIAQKRLNNNVFVGDIK